MTTLADVRSALVTAVAEAAQPAPVFAYWPANVSAPCAVVELGRGVQHKHNHWETDWHITVIGPAGDNQSAALWVEKTALAAAAAVSDQFTSQVDWSRPAATPYAGGTYYTAELTVTADVAT